MKKWTLHIIIGLLTSLLISCSSILDEESIQEKDKVGISFTLSLNSVGSASRSLTSDIATQYENAIDPDKFRVLAYADGKVYEVTIFSMKKISESTYKISGKLKDVYNIEKVVVLANCDNSLDPLTSSLGTLTFSYAKDDFNPENSKNYIPMWGVKTITTSLEPGKSSDIGTISLLRAMAKVQVKLSDKSLGCTLVSAKMTRYNKKGACVPGGFATMAETSDVEYVTIPSSSVGANLSFDSMSDGSYVLYIPEFQNLGGQDIASIDVSIKDVNGVYHNETIKFGKYNSSGKFADEYWNVIRNYYYAFNLLMTVEADSKLNLQIETEKYAEWVLNPSYGD